MYRRCDLRHFGAARPRVRIDLMSATEAFVVHPNQGPFLEHLGPVLRREDGDELVLALETDERHLNHRGVVQGGVLSTLADFAIGRAIERDAEDGRDRATVSLTVDYLKPVKAGQRIETRTSVDRVGGTLAFADCSLCVEGREVVRARAVYVVA